MHGGVSGGGGGGAYKKDPLEVRLNVLRFSFNINHYFTHDKTLFSNVVNG